MRTIALAIMLSCALQAETRLNFIIQSNNPLCIGERPISSLTCPPPELWKAGIMAMVANDDPAVVAYLITVTAKLKDGSPFAGSTVAEKWPAPTVYTAAVIWIGKEPSDFADVRVSVETLRKDPGKVEGVTPGIEVVAKDTIRFRTDPHPVEWVAVKNLVGSVDVSSSSVPWRHCWSTSGKDVKCSSK